MGAPAKVRKRKEAFDRCFASESVEERGEKPGSTLRFFRSVDRCARARGTRPTR